MSVAWGLRVMHLCGIQNSVKIYVPTAVETVWKIFQSPLRNLFIFSSGIGLYLPIMDQIGILDLHQRNKWKTRGRSAAINGVYM